MRLRILLAAVAAAAAVTACSASPAPVAAHAKAAEHTYYLALGDSLSQGVQPDAAGASVETRYGYPDQVYAALRRSHPALQLVKLGCPGETTSTMINGGICRYRAGSQLAAAVAFLPAHRGRVLLVTIDIGANDPEHCGGQPDLKQLVSSLPASRSRAPKTRVTTHPAVMTGSVVGGKAPVSRAAAIITSRRCESAANGRWMLRTSGGWAPRRLRCGDGPSFHRQVAGHPGSRPAGERLGYVRTPSASRR